MKRFSIILLFIYSLCFSQANKFFFATSGNKSAFSVYALAYKARIITNGGTISDAMLTNIDNTIFIPLGANPTLRAKVRRWNVFGGSDIKAAVCPLYNNADDGSDTLGYTKDLKYGFVDGDLGIGGLTGDGATKWLNTGYIPFNNGTHLSTGIGVGLYTKSTSGSVNQFLFDSYEYCYDEFQIYMDNGNFCITVEGATLSTINPFTRGIFIVSRNDGTNQFIYKNQIAGVQQAVATYNRDNISPAAYTVFSRMGSYFSICTLSGYIITSGLTQADAQALIDMWNNFEKTRNAGYY